MVLLPTRLHTSFLQQFKEYIFTRLKIPALSCGYPGPHLVSPLFYSSNSRKYLAGRQLSVHNKKTRDICILSVRSDYASSTNMFPRKVYMVQYDAVLIVYLFLLYKFTHFLIKFAHPLR
jgi:hypothetical protein